MDKNKKIAISSIGSEDVIIVDITENLKNQLKIVLEANKNMISKKVFNEGIIYKIPVSTCEIESYQFSTIFERNYEGDKDVLASSTIEYLALDEEDRIIHAKKFNVPSDCNFFDFNEDSYNNLTKNGQGGFISISGTSINIGCNKYAFGETILSETIDLLTIIE